MSKNFNMKDLDEAREIARTYNQASRTVTDCEDKLKNLNVPYDARKLLKNNPETEFVEIKSCKVSYLTTGAISPHYFGFGSGTVTKPAKDGKMLVEIID